MKRKISKFILPVLVLGVVTPATALSSLSCGSGTTTICPTGTTTALIPVPTVVDPTQAAKEAEEAKALHDQIETLMGDTASSCTPETIQETVNTLAKEEASAQKNLKIVKKAYDEQFKELVKEVNGFKEGKKDCVDEIDAMSELADTILNWHANYPTKLAAISAKAKDAKTKKAKKSTPASERAEERRAEKEEQARANRVALLINRIGEKVVRCGHQVKDVDEHEGVVELALDIFDKAYDIDNISSSVERKIDYNREVDIDVDNVDHLAKADVVTGGESFWREYQETYNYTMQYGQEACYWGDMVTCQRAQGALHHLEQTQVSFYNNLVRYEDYQRQRSVGEMYGRNASYPGGAAGPGSYVPFGGGRGGSAI